MRYHGKNCGIITFRHYVGSGKYRGHRYELAVARPRESARCRNTATETVNGNTYGNTCFTRSDRENDQMLPPVAAECLNKEIKIKEKEEEYREHDGNFGNARPIFAV